TSSTTPRSNRPATPWCSAAGSGSGPTASPARRCWPPTSTTTPAATRRPSPASSTPAAGSGPAAADGTTAADRVPRPVAVRGVFTAVDAAPARRVAPHGGAHDPALPYVMPYVVPS